MDFCIIFMRVFNFFINIYFKISWIIYININKIVDIIIVLDVIIFFWNIRIIENSLRFLF